MRIALFTEVFPPKVDGITNRLRHTLRCLALRGHELRVFAPDVAEAEHPGARVIRISGLPFPLYPGLRVTLPDPRIGLELAGFRPDVVHAVGPACLGVWGIAAARASSAGGRAPLLLYVGRLAREKRLETLGWVVDAIPKARLALVGEGPDRERLASIFAGNPVHFAGTLHGEELAAAFASADVFVLPSDTETLGFVALEAMSSGCPVVAADAGGIPDLVEHGTNGLLFDPERPEDAVAAVRALLDDPARRRVFAERARKFAEGCTWEAETRRLELAYAEAIRVQRRRSRLGRLRRLFQADAVPV